MKQLLDITITACFEILDSETYGGPGSRGYAKVSMEGVKLKKLEEKLSDDYLEKLTQGMADMAKVPRENVQMISKTAYDLFTEDSDCECDELSGRAL